jgi:hypothetical protein
MHFDVFWTFSSATLMSVLKSSYPLRLFNCSCRFHFAPQGRGGNGRRRSSTVVSRGRSDTKCNSNLFAAVCTRCTCRVLIEARLKKETSRSSSGVRSEHGRTCLEDRLFACSIFEVTLQAYQLRRQSRKHRSWAVSHDSYQFGNAPERNRDIPRTKKLAGERDVMGRSKTARSALRHCGGAMERVFCTFVSPGRSQDTLGPTFDRFCSSSRFAKCASHYDFTRSEAQSEVLRTCCCSQAKSLKMASKS